jgi:hypothetical protein
MARPFLLIRVGRDEEERFDLFVAVKGASRSRRRREGSPGAPGRVRHADGGVHGSAAVEQERERCYCHAGPCTWCTVDQVRERAGELSPP